MDKNTQKFLQVIRQIESSGGKNVNHPTMQSGLHAGDTAFGGVGLMPNTVLDVVNRLNALKKLSQHTEPLYQMPKEQINEYLGQNPQAEQEVADFLARNLLARMKGNEERSAYAWNQGSSLQPTDITHENLESSPYVQKYREYSRQKALKKLATNPINANKTQN